MSKFKFTKDLSSLSLVELITLRKLLDHRGPVVRFMLYQEINQFINPKRNHNSENSEEIFSNDLQQPDLSTSSFYNSLKSLEGNGLISFIKRKQKGKERIVAVEATNKARLAIQGITGQFLSMEINDFDYMVKVFGNGMKKIGISHFSNILLVNLTEGIDSRFMKLAFSLADEVFLLSDKGVYESMVKMGFEKLKSSVMFNNVIREPKNIFDIAIIPEYEKEPNFFGLSRINILKESIRVVKQEGVVVLTGRSSIPQVDNFYVNELLSKFEESISGRIFTEEEIKEDMIEAGFTKYEIVDYQGTIVGFGWV